MNQPKLIRVAILFSLLFCFFQTVEAGEKQKREKYFPGDYVQPKYMVEASYNYGKLMAFYTDKPFNVTDNSWMFEGAFYYPVYGKKAWQRKKRYPLLGISLSYANFGNGVSVDSTQSTVKFGKAISIMPHFTVFFLRNNLIDFYARLVLGISYNIDHYDPVENPYNNMVSSDFNHIAQLKLGVYWKLHKNWSLNTGIAFSHISNSGVKKPNLGYNHISGLIGLRYNIKPGKYGYEKGEIPKPEKKNFYTIKYSTGFMQFEQGIPKGYSFMGTFQYSRALNISNKIFGGTTVGYDQARYEWADRALWDEPVYKNKAIEASIFVGDEFYIGDVGLFALLGVYLYQEYNNISRTYWKLGGNYYFPEMGENKTRMFFGINTKSNGFFAEALELSIGASF